MLREEDLKDKTKEDYLKVFKTISLKDSVCWWCTYEITELPVSAPIRYIPERNHFELHGVFCSFSCAKAHVIHGKSVYKDTTLITLLNKRMTGKLTRIKTAPDRTSLKKFGGKMTIEEFRSHSNNPLTNETISKSGLLANCTLVYKNQVNVMVENVDELKRCDAKKKKLALEVKGGPQDHVVPDEPLMINEEKMIQKNNRNDWRGNGKFKKPAEPMKHEVPSLMASMGMKIITE